MKSLRKLFTLALALLLVLECFAGPALATTMDADAESLTVSDEAMAEAESSVPESSDEESSEPASSEPESSVPESSVPENTVPQTSEESSTPEGSEPESSVPESSVPDVTVPEASEPESSIPENTVPESSVPESSEPESEPSEPETSEPEPSEPETSEPEPSEPTIVDSGKCGDNLTWTLDSDGLLVISGKGAMKNYTASSPAPWSGKTINTVVIKSGVTTIGNYAFNKCGVDLFSIPKTVTTIGNYALADNDMQELIFPKGATKLGDYALADCSNLIDLVLPTTLKTIGKHAFARCGFEYIDVPDSVTSLGTSAFYSCSKLKGVYISRSLKLIKERTFEYCAKLEFIMLPGSVTRIDSWAFSGCNSLQYVLYLGTQAQAKAVVISTGNSKLTSVDWFGYTIPTKDPKDVKTIAGKTVTFSTAASRSGCKFQWQYLESGSEEWKNCSSKSAKTATFSFTAKAKHDGYQYRCKITDTYDNEVYTYSATLTIVPAPKITKQPVNAEAKSGKSVSVSVEATGEGLSYQWYIAKKGSSKFSKSSITKSTYTTTMKDSVNGRKVYCVVTDKYGQTVKSNTVTLTLETTPLVITKQPESVTVKYGEKAKVTVAAEGDGLTYQWYYAKKGATKFSKASITKATYSAEMNTSRDGRQLYCVIKDKYGKSVKTDVVTINLEKTPLEIVTQPVSASAGYGKRATVTVVAQGDGLTYQWYYAKKGATKFSKASITKATYSAEMDTSRDGRQLYCVITDAYGNSVQTETVSISLERKELAIVTQPVSVSVKNGKTAKVTVKATGDGLTYQWYYAAKGSKKFSKASIKTATYSTTMNSSRNGRQLYCVITDAYGNSVKTNTVTIKKK